MKTLNEIAVTCAVLVTLSGCLTTTAPAHRASRQTLAEGVGSSRDPSVMVGPRRRAPDARVRHPSDVVPTPPSGLAFSQDATPSQSAGTGGTLGATSAIPQSAPEAQAPRVTVAGFPVPTPSSGEATSASSETPPSSTDSGDATQSPPPAEAGSSPPPGETADEATEPPPIVAGLADTTPPQIVIQSPTSLPAHATHTPSLRLSGRATDDVGVIRVLWSAEAGAAGVAEGTTRWQPAALPLQEGENVLRVSAVDAAGNLTQAQLSVRLDTVAPVVRVTFPAHGAQFGPDQP